MAATLLLVGQLLYVVITLFHPGGEGNNHPAIFTAYAASGIWTAVHVAQFACMAIMLAGLLALFSALTDRLERRDVQVDSVPPRQRPRWRCTAPSWRSTASL